jgi:hypothetical protein
MQRFALPDLVLPWRVQRAIFERLQAPRNLLPLRRRHVARIKLILECHRRGDKVGIREYRGVERVGKLGRRWCGLRCRCGRRRARGIVDLLIPLLPLKLDLREPRRVQHRQRRHKVCEGRRRQQRREPCARLVGQLEPVFSVQEVLRDTDHRHSPSVLPVPRATNKNVHRGQRTLGIREQVLDICLVGLKLGGLGLPGLGRRRD